MAYWNQEKNAILAAVVQLVVVMQIHAALQKARCAIHQTVDAASNRANSRQPQESAGRR